MSTQRWILLPGLFAILLAAGCKKSGQKAVFEDRTFNAGWEFTRSDDSTSAFAPGTAWEQVTLPHTARIEPLVVNNQWQGTCWYRRRFWLDQGFSEKNLFLRFDGAMNMADVWVNGVKKTRHLGGYLPFSVNFTAEAIPGDTNEVIVKLDNRDNPVTGPKPLEVLDFNMY
jgi:beta-galactosidase